MDLNTKIYGLLCMIVVTIKLIHGHDALYVARQGSKNEDPETKRQLKQVPDKRGKVEVGITTHSKNKEQPESPSPGQEKMKVPDKSEKLALGWERSNMKGKPLALTSTDQEQLKQVPNKSEKQIFKKKWSNYSRGVKPSPGQDKMKPVPDKTEKLRESAGKYESAMLPTPSWLRFLGQEQLKQDPHKTENISMWPGKHGPGFITTPPLFPLLGKETLKQVQPGSPPLGHELLEFVSMVPQHEDSPHSTTFTGEWPYGIVPYYIDKDTNDENLKRRIQKTMAMVEASSCVIFKEKTEKSKGHEITSWLHFINPNQQRECSHNMIEGDNKDIIIVLGIECLKTRDILHSLLHGLGFKDEVSHPHRDQYIRIQWENVQPRYRPLFRVGLDEAPYKLVEYDPMSIMHFHDRAYSENGALTIVPVMPGLLINPSDKLSQLDVMKLRIMFDHECYKRKVGSLIDNCKNVLYNKNEHMKGREINPNGTTQDSKIKDGDGKQLNAKNDNKKELNTDEDGEQELHSGDGDNNQQ